MGDAIGLPIPPTIRLEPRAALPDRGGKGPGGSSGACGGLPTVIPGDDRATVFRFHATTAAKSLWRHTCPWTRVLMRMIVKRANGVRIEAVLLSFNTNRMRVAIAEMSDTVEFTMQGGHWVDECGELIEFEALLPIEGVGLPKGCAEVFLCTMAVGSLPN